MLTCPICHQNYTTSGENQPRLLTICGHTFCFRCLEERKKESPDGFQCPQCSLACREDHVPNITIMKYVEAMNQEEPIKQQQTSAMEVVTCQACQTSKATLICYQCLPAGFAFCDSCSSQEHNRNFVPVQRHVPKPIGGAKVQTQVPTCGTHPENPCLYFSFKINQFACDSCKALPGFSEDEFQPIEEAVQRVRRELPSLTKLVRERVESMGQTQAELDERLSKVNHEKMKTMDRVRAEFNQFDIALKRRQQHVLQCVEQEATIQHKALQEQMDRLEVAQGDAETSVVQANMILQMQDYTYLYQAEQVMTSMKSQLAGDDLPIYQGPVASGEIPLHISPTFLDDVTTLGVVGGGRQPTHLNAIFSKGLILVTWETPENDTVTEYEVQYGSMGATGGGAILSDSDSNLKSTLPLHALSVKCKGAHTQQWIDKLFPGRKYNFRIRALNMAGWGIWSMPVVCDYPECPITLEYTGEIVEIIMPSNGLYCITACGAKAEDGETRKGGRGAIIEAKFLLNKHDALIILCGGMSKRVGPCTGGGGGTFVAVNKKRDLLIAAGGGGGTRGYDSEDYDGVDANASSGEGRDGVGTQWSNGGDNGGCGRDAIFAGPCWGYGGAGFDSAATKSKSFLHGGSPGEGGGFGGGGAVGNFGGGGGGGYSGGGGGRGGGGGGSFVMDGGVDVKRMVGSEGHGSVTIVHVDG